jgi:hypothetical protein
MSIHDRAGHVILKWRTKSMPTSTQELTSKAHLVIPKSVYETLPKQVNESLSELSNEQQEQFVEAFKSASKGVATAYCFYLLLGSHHAYLGRWGIQAAWWLTLGGLGIWALIDLFSIPRMVNHYNEEVARRVTRKIKALS